MKIELRQEVRSEVGELIRKKQAEKPSIPVVTGMIPSPVPPDCLNIIYGCAVKLWE